MGMIPYSAAQTMESIRTILQLSSGDFVIEHIVEPSIMAKIVREPIMLPLNHYLE